MRPAPFRCLFCDADQTFTGIEHPIPESLGNDDTLLGKGFVCDRCNQYFGSKVERHVLSRPPFSVERVAQAIKTKKGKQARAMLPGLNLHSTGYWDTVIVQTDPYRRPPIDIQEDGRWIIYPPCSKEDAYYISRFLLKMGLELLLLVEAEDPYRPELDWARSYARYGHGQSRWDVGYGLYPCRKDIVTATRVDHLGALETR